MYKIYQINSGDTLKNIADRIGTTVEFLSQINGIDETYELMPGMNIIIPVTEDSIYIKYITKKGDNMYEIAKQYNQDYKDLLKINGLNANDYIYEGQEILIPKSNIKYYITKENDTIKGISSKVGESVYEILDNNENLYVIPDQLIIYKKEKNS